MSELSEVLATLIPNAITDELVTSWLVFIETIDQDGKATLHFEHSEGMKAWTYLGMLEYAKQVELASTVNEAIKDD